MSATQHPQYDAIVALQEQGLNDTVIARQLCISVRVARRIRKDAGLPSAPRTSWTYRPHPQEPTIRLLLGEGHTDTAIREKTGADVGAIARLRKAGAFGRPTIIRVAKRQHPKHAAIVDLLNAGLGDSEIARQLGADRTSVRRIRAEAGVALPKWDPQPLTLEEKWRKQTRPLEDGHLEWTGSRVNAGHTPTMRYRGTSHSPAAVAFRLRTGRDPVGQTKAECGLHQCVAPDHVEDEPGRTRLREQLRHVMGMGPRPAACAHGHDQAEHGRYAPNGVAYCHACQHGEVSA